MSHEELDLNKLREDIRQIKNAIKQNSFMLKKLMYSSLIKLLCWVSGTAALVLPALFYYFIQRYGGYQAVPPAARNWLMGIVTATAVLIISGKSMFYLQIRRLFPRASFFHALSRLCSRQALLLYPSSIFTMMFFVVFFALQGNYYLIVPSLAIGIGIYFSTIGSFTSFTELFVLGNFFWVSGLLSVPFILRSPLSSLLWTAGISAWDSLLPHSTLSFFTARTRSVTIDEYPVRSE